MLKEERAPLVLAAVDSVQVLYREANTYPHLMQLGIEGNPEPLSPEELHAQAWEIVAPVFQRAQLDAVARYYELSNTPQTSCDVREIVPAAHHGRVDVLLVAAEEQQWGRFDPDDNTISLEENQQSGVDDLLDLAAIETLLRGGSVYAVPREKMPDGETLCAVFRY
jgi:hypothetical protein